MISFSVFKIYGYEVPQVDYVEGLSDKSGFNDFTLAKTNSDEGDLYTKNAAPDDAAFFV